MNTKTDPSASDPDGPTHSPEETFDTSRTFADLGLPADVLEGIEKSGFVHPTHIQAALIPAAMSGRHVLGQAKTGTGKTAAFGLPLLASIKPGDRFAALVLVPTQHRKRVERPSPAPAPAPGLLLLGLRLRLRLRRQPPE